MEASPRRETPTTPKQRAALRELGVDLGSGPGSSVRGLLLGTAMIALPLGITMAYLGPPEPAKGFVTGFGVMADGRGRGVNAVRIRVDGRDAMAPFGVQHTCLIGDDVELLRRRLLLGYGYAIGVRGCTRPVKALPAVRPGSVAFNLAC